MKNTLRGLSLVLLLGGTQLWGMPFYRSDAFTTINPAYWQANGTVSGGASGLTSTGAGSAISTEAQSLYETVAKLRLTSCGGKYTVYLRASMDALHTSIPPSPPPAQPQGSYYAVQIALDGSGNPASGCASTVTVVSRVGGSIQLLSTFPLGVRNGSEVRALVRPDGNISLMIDRRHCYWGTPSPALASGRPGVGVQQTPAGNGIALAQLFVLDLITPPTVDLSTIAASTAANRVDLRWRGVEEPPDQIGLWRYNIYRNNVYLTSLPNAGFTDTSVLPDTSYTYIIQTVDLHLNFGAASVRTLRTPVAGAFDPRRTGVKPLGAYWGAGGENIDMNSGNLNYTVPLLKAVGRGSTGVAVNLSYNSQQWRKDTTGGVEAIWKLGEDVGYGFGWKLQVGSLQPLYTDFWSINSFIYTDSTGAEYRLTAAGNGLFTSNESIYITYDSATGKLWSNDGTFWQFGSTSWGNEDDAGTMYPTLVQDSNGNQIKLGYLAGANAAWANSSARLEWIDDPRGRGLNSPHSYSFRYSSDPTPHLTNIDAAYSGSENYTFSYSPVNLVDPFANAPFGTTKVLSGLLNVTPNLSTTFLHNPGGELYQVTLPYGGIIGWGYGPNQYSNYKTYREVTGRVVHSGNGTPPIEHSFLVDGSDAGRQIHIYRIVVDTTSGAAKYYWFDTDTASAYAGLLQNYQERTWPGLTIVHWKGYVWAATSSGNPYVSDAYDTLDPGLGSPSSHVAQTLDAYGNLTRQVVYDYNDPPAKRRTYENTYLSDASHVNAYIRNRLLTATLTAGGTTTTVVQNGYDDYANPATPTQLTAMPESDSERLHDAAYSNTNYLRGNLSWTMSMQNGSTRVYFAYNTGGVVIAQGKDAGLRVTSEVTAATNYMLPSTVTPNSNSNLATSATYNAILGLTQETGPNAATLSIGYDSASRPATSTSPTGAVTTYTYSTSAPQMVATINGRWTKSYLDGLGRTVKEESGTGTGNPFSIVDTTYAACACSPLGKVKKVSRPRALDETAVWTEYTYDVLGRTTQTLLPSSAGSTTYLYEGSTVTVTDPVGKWKRYTQDAFGNLTLVKEQHPAGGNNPPLETYYTYNAFNKLTNVSMTRDGTPQTRTFTYDYQQHLIQTLMPENGFTNYTWGGTQLLEKTGANGNRETYTYDAYERLTRVWTCGYAIEWGGGALPLQPSRADRQQVAKPSHRVHAAIRHFGDGRLPV
ncbi:MAG: hypothetical protein NTW28_38145 [Candidatus Solibacter sp.]|nr:hypothetical protein [Candidatus Solibacter sp.]